MITPTPKQKQIRDHQGLDLVIVAPAGCGKTEALALRVAGLVSRGEVEHPRRVLVTTFSNRARDNVRDRLRMHLAPEVLRTRVTVANFHGLSARIFRAHAGAIGLDPQMTLPDSDWVHQECQRRGMSFDATEAVERALRATKLEQLDDAQVDERLASSNLQSALEIERARRSDNRLTYDDLPRLADLLLANDTVAQLYRNHFAAVIVDEFQDLTPQQLRIVNRIGYRRTTYAGDLAQGIYGFAGARPEHTDAAIRQECSSVIQFAESHRSSPAVLRVVNSLAVFTGGQELRCADPESWPDDGMAGRMDCSNVDREAQFVVAFAELVLDRAPHHRIGVIARTSSRRRFVDVAMESSNLTFHRWDDAVLDTDTAKTIKSMLVRLNTAEFFSAADPLQFLREQAQIDSVQDPSLRTCLNDALAWCVDLLKDGQSVSQIRDRVRIGDEHTLLNVPGVHLLTGHVGKGQQFDWVVIVGAEDGAIPFFRATSDLELAEEARILAVMVSRARHGVVICHASRVPSQSGQEWTKRASRYLSSMSDAGLLDGRAMKEWLENGDWEALCAK
jgi:DNA helicase-2/ATP-dependent DNA helicase PcrA